ncbi:MAG: hypothetical protein HY695_09345 [Deltaproteobacteria bacterium]|nr:hypothetical protein [Deltaproteobacteria bacterium]
MARTKPVGKGSSSKRQADSRQIKLTLYVTPKTIENLERLRLKALDRNGKRPAKSTLIESLINRAMAAHKEEKIPYPDKRR